MTRAELASYISRSMPGESTERLGGRGVDVLAPVLPATPLEQLAPSPCGRRMLGKRHIHVDPYDNVCIGIGCAILGNAGRCSIEDVLGRVSHENNPMLSLLAREGPTHALLAEAVQLGYNSRTGYFDKCHLCYEVRRFLLTAGYYLDEVGPDTWYFD